MCRKQFRQMEAARIRVTCPVWKKLEAHSFSFFGDMLSFRYAHDEVHSVVVVEKGHFALQNEHLKLCDFKLFVAFNFNPALSRHQILLIEEEQRISVPTQCVGCRWKIQSNQVFSFCFKQAIIVRFAALHKINPSFSRIIVNTIKSSGSSC